KPALSERSESNGRHLSLFLNARVFYADWSETFRDSSTSLGMTRLVRLKCRTANSPSLLCAAAIRRAAAPKLISSGWRRALSILAMRRSSLGRTIGGLTNGVSVQLHV